MPFPRSLLINSETAGLYHLVSRCVRLAFLCGDGFDHRRDWIMERLEFLNSVFSLDVVGFVVMSNHLHVLVWTNPDEAASWSAEDVIDRWFQLHPGPATEDDETRERRRANMLRGASRVAKCREQLASVSWMMRCLKEPIARRANREDGVTGHFWEGRFKSYFVADDRAALTVSIYIDLNMIRARTAETPETSRYAGVWQRVMCRQAYAAQERRHAQASVTAADSASSAESTRRLAHDEDGVWLTPFEHGHPASARGGGGCAGKRRRLFGFGVDAYLELVDAAGRQLRAGKRGVIDARLKPILARLELELSSWLEQLRRPIEGWWGTTIGSTVSLAKEAIRRGCRRVVNPLRVE